MDIEKLSVKYRVRKLTIEDVETIYRLSIGNPIYYEYCPPFVTWESILEDMTALPPGKSAEDKFYIGFFDGDCLVAVMDLITGFPKEETAYIGLFMMEQKYQGIGIGTDIITECCAILKEQGFQNVQLGFIKGNSQSKAFWVKNQFVRTGETKQEKYTVVMMERKL